MSKSRDKGTRYETKLLRRLIFAGLKARRTSAGSWFDIEVDGREVDLEPVRALATEPDRGSTLVTVDLEDFLGLLYYSGLGARIECKKWRAFPHHTLFEKEMK